VAVPTFAFDFWFKVIFVPIPVLECNVIVQNPLSLTKIWYFQ